MPKNWMSGWDEDNKPQGSTTYSDAFANINKQGLTGAKRNEYVQSVGLDPETMQGYINNRYGVKGTEKYRALAEEADAKINPPEETKPSRKVTTVAKDIRTNRPRMTYDEAFNTVNKKGISGADRIKYAKDNNLDPGTLQAKINNEYGFRNKSQAAAIGRRDADIKKKAPVKTRKTR